MSLQRSLIARDHRPILDRLPSRIRFATGTRETHIDFDAPATLLKWPSIKNERVSIVDGGRPYAIVGGTLDDCIRAFMTKPINQHHLYEIHTTPQAELITAVLSAEQIVELARLRDFLYEEVGTPKSKTLPVQPTGFSRKDDRRQVA